MKHIKMTAYTDGVTVEDEIGNRVFVGRTLFREYLGNSDLFRFGLGALLFDEIVGKTVQVTTEIIEKNINYQEYVDNLQKQLHDSNRLP